jgi:hypothetical protein
MALPISLSPFGGGPAINYDEWDFHTYARQSSTMSFGNANTGMQEEDLPEMVAKRFGVDRETHPFFRAYQTEVESAADGSLSIRRDTVKKGRLIIDDFERHQLIEIFETVMDRWERYRRPAIIAVTMLNRLGRSDWVLPMLSTYANQTEGNVWIYVASTGAMLNPTNPTDQHTFVAEFSFSGKGENRTKQLAVLGARRRIGTQSGKSTRSLGERTFGYRKTFVDYSGQPLTDEEALDWIQKRSKQPPKALVRVDEYEPIIARMFDLLTVERRRPAQIAAIIDAEFGKCPLTDRPWSARVVRRIFTNPIYRGQRITDRTRALNMGNRKRRRTARPDELVISPVDEKLRFVSDEQWVLAQEIMTDYSTEPENLGRQVPRSRAGRPIGVDLFFHRSGLLRCGLCGGGLTLHSFSVRGKKTYYYRCGKRATLYGQPRCQSHEATAVDKAVQVEMRTLFKSLESLTEEMRTEVKRLRVESSLNLVDRRLEALTAELKRLDSALMLMRLDLAEGKATQREYDRMKGMVEEKADEIAKLEEQRITNQSNLRLKSREARLRQLEGMQAFDKAPFSERKQTLQDMLEAVWIWPDGQMDFQWHGQPEEDVVARSGRPLRIASSWPTINFDELSKQTVRLINEAEMPYVLVDNGAGTGSLRRTMKDIADGKNDTRRQSAAILRGFIRLRKHYFNRPVAVKLVREWLAQEIANGQTLFALANTLNVPRKNLMRFLNNTPLQWMSMKALTEGAVKVGAFDGTEVFTLPEWVYDHEKLEEMAFWLLGPEETMATSVQINEILPRPCTGEHFGEMHNGQVDRLFPLFQRYVLQLAA